MQRSQRKKKQKNLMGNHQRCWIWGRNVVLEILEFQRWRVKELYLSEGLSADRLEEAQALAVGQEIPVQVESSQRLEELCHTGEHQGYLAKMPPFPYASLSEVLDGVESRGKPALFVVLDGVQDPYNFGAIIRSAEVLGVDAVIVGSHHQAAVTSMVVRSSAGAINRIAIVMQENLLDLREAFRERGIALIAASEKAPVDCCSLDLTGSLALVLGNEGRGISPDLFAECEGCVRIPQHGAVGSMNVAMAATVLFYEVSRQRGMPGGS